MKLDDKVKLDDILKKHIGRTIEITCESIESRHGGTISGILKEVNDDFICLEMPTGLMYINRKATVI